MKRKESNLKRRGEITCVCRYNREEDEEGDVLVYISGGSAAAAAALLSLYDGLDLVDASLYI